MSLVVALVAAAGLVSFTDTTYCESRSHGQPEFAPRNFGRTLGGVGTPDFHTLQTVLTTELGHRPFSGALGTGLSITGASDVGGRWFLASPGLLVQVDLTYLFLTSLWSQCPRRDFPVRVQIGTRIGMDVSESFGVTPAYWLIRPTLQPFLDVELPLDRRRVYSLILRVATDATMNLGEVLEWSASVGLSYGWGRDD